MTPVQPPPGVISMAAGADHAVSGRAQTRPLSQHLAAIIAFLEEHPGSTIVEIAAACGFKTNSTQGYIRTLFVRRYIGRQGHLDSHGFNWGSDAWHYYAEARP